VSVWASRLLAAIAAPDGVAWDLPELPPRPGRPASYRIADAPPRRRRSLADALGRLQFLHAIHHIELSAIDLACLGSLRGSGMPAAYHRDQIRVAREEAVHAGLLGDLLQRRDFPAGSAPVHHHLWATALACADLGEHLVVVPRVLEARGLDVTASILDRVASVDAEAHTVLARIYADEIGHVGNGTAWHSAWCAARALDPSTHFIAVCDRRFGQRLRTAFPLDLHGRDRAGFRPAELAHLAT
jgi:uncharacterized ferritin-like protein (DUF455 family)